MAANELIHVMVDLETWGVDPGRDIRSIGACLFNPETGIVFTQDTNAHVGWHHPFYRNVDGGEAYGLTRDASTVEWWRSQSDEARSALGVDPVDLVEGLVEFSEWLYAVCPDPTILRLWSHGPSMDEVMLRVCCQMTGQPVPWHYRAPRDTRTLFERAGMHPHKCLADFATGTLHNALDDAITQARAVCAAWHRQPEPEIHNPAGWFYAFSEDAEWWSGDHGSREHAIAAAAQGDESIWVAEAKRLVPSFDLFDGEEIIERINEDECWGEDGWNGEGDPSELARRLAATVKRWFAETCTLDGAQLDFFAWSEEVKARTP